MKGCALFARKKEDIRCAEKIVEKIYFADICARISALKCVLLVQKKSVQLLVSTALNAPNYAKNNAPGAPKGVSTNVCIQTVPRNVQIFATETYAT